MNFVRRVLIGDRPERGLGRSLALQRPDLEVRDVARDEIGAADLQWAEAYIGFRPPLGADFEASALRWVHSTGAGVDGFLETTALPPRARLTRTAGAFGTRIAEYCLARALFEYQEMERLQQAQRERRWEVFTPREIAESKIAILGTGRIGADIALAFKALGARVVGISAHGAPQASFDAVLPVSRANEALRDAHFVIAALPLTPTTRGLIDERMLQAMRGAYLINVGRGATVVESALLDALRHGVLRAAALDVFTVEPLRPNAEFWSLPNVLVSPHIAARTADHEILDSFVACLSAFECGERPTLEVDPARGY